MLGRDPASSLSGLEMVSDSATSSSACSPAPYGRACAGCSRAKCKCFYRSDGSACERCHRLGKACEPALAVRKRKAQTPPPTTQPPAPPIASRLEEKLDDLVTLLRSQAVEKQIHDESQRYTPQSTGRYGGSTSPTPAHQNPDVMIDTTASVIHLLRPATPEVSRSPILEDISTHQVPDRMAEDQLDLFRRAFVSLFPFVHIPATTSASEFRRQKPFLWLVMISLTTKVTSQQFAIEETIWHIISHRIVSQHLMDLDLLLGVICFASWSHYFKKEKPFMCMLSQLAVSLAFELGIHQDSPSNPPRRSRLLAQPTTQRPRTMEERRAIIALYHLTSATWSAYRKTEPLRWSPYMDDCLRLLCEGRETPLDIVLATQVKCQIITYQLTRPSASDPAGGESSKTQSTMLTAALLRQLNEIRQSLPTQFGSDRHTQFYLNYTEIKIRESLFGKPKVPDQTCLSNFHRLQDLDSALRAIENWLAIFFAWPVHDCIGVNVDIFSQFSQCLVVLFKLATLDEPGWDLEEVRRRADVFAILDRFCEFTESVPAALGIVDADGPRRGLFFKVGHLIRAIKALFLAELPQNAPQGAAVAFPTPKSGAEGNEMNGTPEIELEPWLMDDVLLNMMYDDIQIPAWDFRPDDSYIPYTT
ncbi:hypothetical protein F4818DRAFT_396279 [Hypoxylon cercidicola]|nr:hypothetical protein F4818DRAFT_396279 [Hypoxylon cercidicola]